MPFGKRLKAARIAKKMTQEELAEAVGVTKGAIGNYESEVSSPKENILIALMKVLGVDANYLYQDYVQSVQSLSDIELRLVTAYRGATDSAREIALEILEKHQNEESPSRVG